MRETREQRPLLADDVEVLAERASSRGALRRANDLRAVAEHLRAKETRQVIDVRPEALAVRRSGFRGRLRQLRGPLRQRLGRLRLLLGRPRSR
jgi:hypothetical protein